MSVDLSREKAIKKAKDSGLTIVESNDRLLLLDIDTESDLEMCRKVLAMIGNRLDYSHATVTRSKSNKWHVYIHLNTPRPLYERILVQACMGSDRMREVLNYIADGGKECLLFETATATHEQFAKAEVPA